MQANWYLQRAWGTKEHAHGVSSLAFDTKEWARFTLRTSDRANIKRPNEPLVVINEKRSLFRPALVRGYEAEKLGRSGKEVAGKANGGKAMRRRRVVYIISVEIVCSAPAGKSLINSRLVRYLTDLKNEKKDRRRGVNDGGEGGAGRTRNVLYLWRNRLAGGL